MTEEELVKISELDPVDTLYDGCCMPLVQMGETKKIEYATLKSKLNEDLDFVKDTDDLEQRLDTLEDNEAEQDEAIRDLRNGYNGKVDKVAGKGLSTNDYTTEDKTLLNDIYNTLPTNEVSGEQIHITDAAAFPLKKLSADGNSYQYTTTGKNLYPLDKRVFSSNGVTATYDYKGYCKLTGTANQSWANICNSINFTLPAGTYTISTTNVINHTVGFKGRYVDSTIFEFVIASGGKSRTFTTTKEIESGYFYIGGLTTGSAINETITLQLESGSTATEYEPYTNGASPNPDFPQEVEVVEGFETETQGIPAGNIGIKNIGKNLFDKNNTESNKRVKEDGTLENSTGYYASDFIKVTPNTSYSMTRAGTHRGKFYDSNKNALTNTYDFNASSGNITFNTTPNCQYVRFTIDSIYLDTLQLEQETATPYEPYTETITPIDLQGNFIGKIGDTKDTLSIDSKGNVKLTKRIGKVVLDGSENWNNDGGTQGTDYRHNIYYAGRMSIPVAKGTNGTYLSNYFATRNVSSDSGELGTFYMSNTWLVFVDKNKVYDLENWKTWLSTHNTEVYYILAEPYEVDLGQITLPVLNKGVNHISLLANMESNMSVEYIQDIKSLITNLTNAVVSLGGNI